MNKILCSTGAITGKTNGYDYRLLEPLSKQLLCDGFELMMDSIWYEDIDALKHYLQKVNLYIPVVHCEKDIGEMISKGGETELARAYGLELLVENVVCNVENPMKHLCELKEIYPDIRFLFDTKMAAFHEQLDLLYDTEYEWLWKEGYIRHYHVNDYAGGYMDWGNLKTLPVGKGKLDFTRFFDFIKRTGYTGDFTTEGNAVRSDGTVDVDMLNEQFKRIHEYTKGVLYAV